MLIVLNAGHGKPDPGATATHNGISYIESDMNLTLANHVYNKLIGYNVEPVIIQDGDPDRLITTIKELKPDLVLSLHHNSATNKTACGIEVIESVLTKSDDILASAISFEITKIAPIKIRGLGHFSKSNSHGKDWYFMQRLLSPLCTTLTIEPGFISNPTEAGILKQYSEKIGEGIADVIIKHYALKEKESVLTPAEKIVNRLIEEKILTSTEWLDKWNDPAPVYLPLAVVNRLLDRIKKLEERK